MNGSVCVLIPYFGGNSSAANSQASKRPHYFRKTVESLRPLAPARNTVVGVCLPEDKQISPHAELLQCEPKFLAAELCRWAQRHVLADYFYVTEADQVFHANQDVLDAVSGDTYLAPHRLEQVYEHPTGTLMGSDRGYVVRYRGRLWVLPNGNPDAWGRHPHYEPENEQQAFGGGFLASRELFMRIPFTDVNQCPVEHATGFQAYRTGRCLKTGMWSDFCVEHLSGLEYHQGLAVNE